MTHTYVSFPSVACQSFLVFYFNQAFCPDYMERASPSERVETTFSPVLHDTSQPGTATKLARVSYLWRNCENFLVRLLNDIFNNI